MNRSTTSYFRLAFALFVALAACGDNLHPAGADDVDARMGDGTSDGSNPLQAPMVTFTSP